MRRGEAKKMRKMGEEKKCSKKIKSGKRKIKNVRRLWEEGNWKEEE